MDYKLPDYEMCHISRTNKKGGVAICINEYISYKLSENLSTSIDNVLECVTIDICIIDKKVITVCSLYRQTDSNIEVLNETLEHMFRNKKTTIYLCGDFNINLSNYDSHKGTRYFIDVLFSLGLFPLICKPSRITEYSATLIDNIFTNDLNNCFLNCLLINDINDHLPIFCMVNHKFDRKDWNMLYNTTDENTLYDNFIDIFFQNCTTNLAQTFLIKDKKERYTMVYKWS